MNWTICLLAMIVTVAVVVGSKVAASGTAEVDAPIFGIKIPPGYRDRKVISVAHEEGKLNDIRAILGNDLAIKTYREGATEFPDGAIIARLVWKYESSEENNNVFGWQQSLIAGAPTNVQFVVKDSKGMRPPEAGALRNSNNDQPDRTADLTTCCQLP